MSKIGFEYICRYYGVPAKRGGRVRLVKEGTEGKITGTRDQYLLIRLDGEKYTGVYHPTDGIEYLAEVKA